MGILPQVARGQALQGRRNASASASTSGRKVCCSACRRQRLFAFQLRPALTGRWAGVQVTQMIATGPKPPLSFNSSNDESPVKLNIGGGMGEHAETITGACIELRRCQCHGSSALCRHASANMPTPSSGTEAARLCCRGRPVHQHKPGEQASGAAGPARAHKAEGGVRGAGSAVPVGADSSSPKYQPHPGPGLSYWNA